MNAIALYMYYYPAWSHDAALMRSLTIKSACCACVFKVNIRWTSLSNIVFLIPLSYTVKKIISTSVHIGIEGLIYISEYTQGISLPTKGAFRDRTRERASKELNL